MNLAACWRSCAASSGCADAAASERSSSQTVRIISSQSLKQMEAHIDSGGGSYRFAVERAGTKCPLQDRFDGLLVQAHAHALYDAWIDHFAGGVHLDIDHHLALKP